MKSMFPRVYCWKALLLKSSCSKAHLNRPLAILTKQLGYSIVELMIAMLLGFLLVSGIIQFFVNNKNTYRFNEGLAHIQDNGRYAKLIMSQDIRMTGYQGCSNNAIVTPRILVNPPLIFFTTDKVIQGYQSVAAKIWSPILPSSLSTQVVNNTDVITILEGSQQNFYLMNNMASSGDVINLSAANNFVTDDVLLITDCIQADIFRATSVTLNPTTITHNFPANISTNLSKAYQTDARVSKLLAYSYYIHNTGKTNSTGLPILALYRQDINGNNQELVAGVENMHINYGVDTDGDSSADTYLTADAVDSGNYWPQVISVRIFLLLNSIEELGTKPQSYTFDGVSYNPTDRLLRREWDIFITLRNRVS